MQGQTAKKGKIIYCVVCTCISAPSFLHFRDVIPAFPRRHSCISATSFLHFRDVIPAKAGILTRIAINEDHIAVDNYAGIP